MTKKCEFCGEEYKVKPFIPMSKTSGKRIFEYNEWFWAWIKCKCGTFTIDRKYLEEGWKPKK